MSPAAAAGRINSARMTALYDSPNVALGYAKARPPVHREVLQLVQQDLGVLAPLAAGLDVGCGAGLSTRALQAIASQCLGIDPSAAMIARAPAVAPGASFQVGSAERLPVEPGTIDIITAAGSLNYVDLKLFFLDAARVLRPEGVVVVYDFTPGRSLADSPALDAWFNRFLDRYPFPRNFGREITRELLAHESTPLRLAKHREFQVSLSLTPSAYVNYVLTETNVLHAVGNGTPETEIRAWCTDTLTSVFNGAARTILFRGYIAYFAHAAVKLDAPTQSERAVR